ncbi:hypothetical protein BDW02DRAFT_601384 [Decorospora gaudefroyi]|uniref:Uncharacterized protein n=1 Tax=Decorospora gaudefroyi TaxID=184978 RepID=A0A6A5K1B8_9PLEO|nr:hypothetical protein BDW02DRAFT_601384 [Decorospora gaudefroyi]
MRLKIIRFVDRGYCKKTDGPTFMESYSEDENPFAHRGRTLQANTVMCIVYPHHGAARVYLDTEDFNKIGEAHRISWDGMAKVMDYVSSIAGLTPFQAELNKHNANMPWERNDLATFSPLRYQPALSGSAMANIRDRYYKAFTNIASTQELILVAAHLYIAAQQSQVLPPGSY